jgi:hypothetical protein
MSWAKQGVKFFDLKSLVVKIVIIATNVYMVDSLSTRMAVCMLLSVIPLAFSWFYLPHLKSRYNQL